LDCRQAADLACDKLVSGRAVRRHRRAYRKTGSITKAFRDTGLPDYIRAMTEITATHADAADITDLELSPGAIAMVTRAMNTDLTGVPVQYSITRFAATGFSSR